MGLAYKKLIRPLLFKQDPERAHDMGVFMLKILGELGPITRLMGRYNRTEGDPIELFGLRFPNAVGIAAGFDKNAECYKATPALGFGHIEVGTITHERQPGNPKPRLFRFPQSEAIINKMGFNNNGAQAVAKHLAKTLPKIEKRHYVLGINIGKSKATPLEEAVNDYLGSFHLLADYADYFTINVSSPNTQGLRALQNKEHLPQLLQALSKANSDRAKKMGTGKIPLLLKISPDLSFPEIDLILETLHENDFSGIIATNTTLQRPTPLDQVDCSGGLSGRPLHPLSLNIIRYISLATNGKLPIIASGGIMDPVSAGKALDVGASLVQLYTGLIYEGPMLGREIARSLSWSHKDWI